MFQNQGQGDPPVITQQPGMNPQFMQNSPYPPTGPPMGQQYPPPQQYPMGQYPVPPPGGGYPQPMQGGYPPQGGYPGGYPPQGPYYNQHQPMMGQQQSGGGGMMSKVMGMVNEVVDVNPMNSMHSAGDILTGHRAPPVMPFGPVEGCPPGLELLIDTEHLQIKQQIEKMEALLAQVGVAVETPNRYDICNTQGNRIYFAAEQGGLLGMQFSPSGSTRPFKIVVVDFSGRPVLNIERPWGCLFCFTKCCNCFGSCGTLVKVSLGDGSYLGSITQPYNCCSPKLVVEDDAGGIVAEIVGPTCADCCCACPGSCGCDVNFQVQIPDGTNVGEITKKFSGFVQEGFTDADNFGVSFPKIMDVRAKAMMMAAVFLIDFMFFEENPQTNQNRLSD